MLKGSTWQGTRSIDLTGESGKEMEKKYMNNNFLNTEAGKTMIPPGVAKPHVSLVFKLPGFSVCPESQEVPLGGFRRIFPEK